MKEENEMRDDKKQHQRDYGVILRKPSWYHWIMLILLMELLSAFRATRSIIGVFKWPWGIRLWLSFMNENNVISCATFAGWLVMFYINSLLFRTYRHDHLVIISRCNAISVKFIFIFFSRTSHFFLIWQGSVFKSDTLFANIHDMTYHW